LKRSVTELRIHLTLGLLPGDSSDAACAIILRIMRHFGISQHFTRIAALSILFLSVSGPQGSNFGAAQTPYPNTSVWRADHHMHLASAELCALVGECLPSNQPPAVFATDAVSALDEARIAKGVVLSCAYLYGLPSLHLKPEDLAVKTRKENEFTAAQVAQYPARLVGFLSVDPLADSAIDEIHHWHGSRQLIGLKLHFFASAVNIRSFGERRQNRYQAFRLRL